MGELFGDRAASGDHLGGFPPGRAAARAVVGKAMGELFGDRAGGGDHLGLVSPGREAGPDAIEDVLADSDVIAYYGHPDSRHMGILGELRLTELADRVIEVAQTYDEVNGRRHTVPAFHIVYGVAHPGGKVGIIDEERLARYLQYAWEEGILVVLDHQLGTRDAEEAVRGMLPYLRFDNVHLAIDPEWSTDKPGEELGSVTADEVNRAQRAMQEYLVEHGIAERKMLVVHQFNWKMIARREEVRSDFSRVSVIHNMDGFGPPAIKFSTWRFVRDTKSMPLKGFKLFYPKSWREGGWDEPLLKPEEVMALEPQPVFIQYQ
ncbi:MAG: hypothetical protein ACQEXJ_18230 [Myxococcota bacterium]